MALSPQRFWGFWLSSLGISFGFIFYFSQRERAREAERRATEARLKLLESQLEPHMLFNTLANLRVLIVTDPARAQAMLDRLIAFLRATLNASRAGRHTLAAEFDRLSDYLALMGIRMGPRLTTRLDLPEALRELTVPPLLLQPLVENSIKHGLEPQVEGGMVEVEARRHGAVLALTVRDTGVGLPEGRPFQETGFGLLQVRERLATLYGREAKLVISAAHDGRGGTLATVHLPIDHPTP
jgi:LytS/YehU family sensor histidine kinase